MGSEKIWTPKGIQTLETISVPDDLMLWLRTFSEFSEQGRMGLHCSLCKQDIVADRVAYGTVHLTMRCGCRQFKGVDPVALLQQRKAEQETEALKNGTATDLQLQ